jgi:hypothetical protein
VQPSAALALSAELLDDWRSLTSRFAVDPDGPGFLVTEEADHGLFVTVEVGTLVAMPRWELDLRFAGDFGRDTMDAYRLSAGFASPLSSAETLGFGLGTSGLDGLEARIDYRMRF